MLSNAIKQIERECARLEQDITALQNIDVNDDPEEFNRLYYQAVMRSEFLVLKLRQFLYDTTDIQPDEYLEKAADTLGITISCNEGGIVDITLPNLMPTRKYKATDVILAPLYVILKKFVADRSHKSPFKRFEHCAICITNVYDKSLLKKQRIRDPDNIEIKGIIDVINTFLLVDDSGNLCTYVNASEISDNNFTRISIMKSDMLPAWILRHQNRLKTMSQN